ncbi:MAG: hypothetical protein Q8930_12445 [Bacillota bacterium]|nr:hypothetical protein [Bacillota bacterium]
MEKGFKNIYSCFISILLKLLPLIIIILLQTTSVISADLKADRTLHIIMNIFIWIFVISIINKTGLKYYLVGYDESQFAKNNRLDSGILAKLFVTVAALLNAIFFIAGFYRAYLIALELILLAAADAITEVKIRSYMED